MYKYLKLKSQNCGYFIKIENLINCNTCYKLYVFTLFVNIYQFSYEFAYTHISVS